MIVPFACIENEGFREISSSTSSGSSSGRGDGVGGSSTIYIYMSYIQYIILNKTLPFGCSPFSPLPKWAEHPERFIIQVFGKASSELKTGKMPCIPSEVGMLSCYLFLCMGVSKNKGTPKMDGL